MYIAVDMNLAMINAEPDSAQKTNALKYHKKIKQNQAQFVQKVNESLDQEVTREGIDRLTSLYRTYDLRLMIAGDKKQ